MWLLVCMVILGTERFWEGTFISERVIYKRSPNSVGPVWRIILLHLVLTFTVCLVHLSSNVRFYETTAVTSRVTPVPGNPDILKRDNFSIWTTTLSGIESPDASDHYDSLWPEATTIHGGMTCQSTYFFGKSSPPSTDCKWTVEHVHKPGRHAWKHETSSHCISQRDLEMK